MGKKTKGNSIEKAQAKAAKKAKQEKSAQKKALKDQKKAQDRVDTHHSTPKNKSHPQQQQQQPQQSGGKKGKKKGGKMDEDDLDALLDAFKKEWEQDHEVQEERASGPPSRRANATLTACPLGADLWLFGGEYFDGERYVVQYRMVDWRKGAGS